MTGTRSSEAHDSEINYNLPISDYDGTVGE